MTATQQNRAKQAVGEAAAELILPGMLVGLGTGSTAEFFIEALSKKCAQGLKIQAVASSSKSLELARKRRIPLADLNSLLTLDITVDGADEIDPLKRMIKGGGGALLREKIIACMSREMVVIVDSSKVVSSLGKFPLPLEISPFAWRATLYAVQQAGYQGRLRLTQQGETFVSDNGNYIFDMSLPFPCLFPEKIEESLQQIPGILQTGFFFNLARKVLVGYPDGHVEVQP